MVDVHYFLFVVSLNADTAVVAGVVLAMAFVALKMVYRMWKSNLKCPHCGESYRNHRPEPPVPTVSQSPPLPNSLWT
jgi:multisubunit Na+/H+ antiporter MnhB subunit